MAKTAKVDRKLKTTILDYHCTSTSKENVEQNITWENLLNVIQALGDTVEFERCCKAAGIEYYLQHALR